MPRHDSRSLFRPAPYIGTYPSYLLFTSPILPLLPPSLLPSFTQTLGPWRDIKKKLQSHEQIHRRQVLDIAAAILTGNRDIGSPEMAICSDHLPNHESSTCNIYHRGTTETGRANRIYPQLFDDDAQVWAIYTSKHRFTSDLFTVASALELSECNSGSL